MNRFIQKPRTLFLMDSLGAFTTAFMLFAIVRSFNHYFGMPQKVLNVLSLTALVFCLYSFTCYVHFNKHWRSLLLGIAMANFCYCCVTFFLVVYYFEKLTLLGVTYFVAEIVVVLALVFVELSTVRKWPHKHNTESHWSI